MIRGASVLDVGCATGEFLYYLSSVYPGLCMTGVDTDEGFLEKARLSIPGAAFLRGDIHPGKGLPTSKFDVVFMADANYLFSDPAPWLRNICALTKGKAYVFGVFNHRNWTFAWWSAALEVQRFSRGTLFRRGP
jgi:SAM-dependent methyltransferase